MLSVKKLLEGKHGHTTWTVTPEHMVIDALHLMAEKNIGAVLVMEDDRLAGIFSERDYARKIILQGKSSKETLVKEIMSDRVAYVTPSATLEECMALMTEKRFRHLPVLDETGNVVGMISIGDMVKETISNQKFLIEQLERYIAG